MTTPRPPAPGPVLLLALVVLLSAFDGCGGEAGDAPVQPLPPVPAPDLSRAEPAVREQVAEARRALEDAANGTGEERAQAYGDLGLTYLIYDFLDAARVAVDNAHRLAPEDFRWSYLAGYLRQVQGDLDAAVPLLETAVERQPDYLPAHLRLGRAWLDLGQPEEAAAAFERAREIEPGSAAALEGLGRVAVARGETETAVALFETALELEPDASALHYALGQAHRRLGNDERAAFHLERSGDVPPRIPDPLLNPLALEARSEPFYAMQGAEALEDRDYPSAAGAFTALLEQNPASFQGHRGLARALAAMGDVDGAVDTLERALERGEAEDATGERAQRMAIHRRLGQLEAGRGADAEAVQHFARALELSSNAPPHQQGALWILQANALARQQRFEEAVAAYTRALEVEPGLAAQVFQRRATARVNLGQEDAAVEDFEAAVAASPNDPTVRLAFADALDFLGRPQEAERQRRLARQAGPGSAETRLLLEQADRSLRRGAFSAAETAYREVLETTSDTDAASLRLAARRGLAAVLGRQERYDAAVAEYRALLDAAPRDMEARRGLPAALILGGRWGEARMELQESLRLYPRDIALALTQVRLLTSAPEPRVRDGELALEIVRRVSRSARAPAIQEALALALAEADRHDEAVATLEQLLAEPDRGTAADRTRWRQQRETFRQELPWVARDPRDVLGG